MTVVLLYTGIDDLFEVEMALQNVNKWQRLGLALGLLYPTLERIDENQRGDIEKCRTKMIAAWLQQRDNVCKNGDPSWVVLRTALKRIGEHQLASQIGEFAYITKLLWLLIENTKYHRKL